MKEFAHAHGFSMASFGHHYECVCDLALLCIVRTIWQEIDNMQLSSSLPSL